MSLTGILTSTREGAWGPAPGLGVGVAAAWVSPLGLMVSRPPQPAKSNTTDKAIKHSPPRRQDAKDGFIFKNEKNPFCFFTFMFPGFVSKSIRPFLASWRLGGKKDFAFATINNIF